jgi:isoleucyl-tRNA synthetase
LAPFTPFVAEEVYQNLVRSVDDEAPESVHLCSWPLADDEAIDQGIAFDMETARRIVEMGRAARNAAAVKTRQPLAEVVVHGPQAERDALMRLGDIVVDELNVKSLRFTESDEELLDYRLKPNLKLLGPKLGKQVAEVGAALTEVEAAEFVRALRTGGSAPVELAGGGQVRLAEEEVLIESVPATGFRVEDDGVRTVALRTEVDDALRAEGLVREVVHAVQLARKNAGLRIEDTIDLALDLPDDLRAVVEPEAAFVKRETLASELEFGAAVRGHAETAKVEGSAVGIALSCSGDIFTVNYG